MKEKQMTKRGLFSRLWLKMPVLLMTVFLLAACNDAPSEKKEIVFGLGPSIYVNQVEGGIIPYLEKKGY